MTINQTQGSHGPEPAPVRPGPKRIAVRPGRSPGSPAVLRRVARASRHRERAGALPGSLAQPVGAHRRHPVVVMLDLVPVEGCVST